MTTLGTTLLIAGLLFPVLSLLTALHSAWTSRTSHHASPVFIPLIGPILLTGCVLVENGSRWLIPLVWALDIGSVVFILVLPALVGEWWKTSSFTRIMTLNGADGIQNAILTLHKTGRYLLVRSWTRANDEVGIVGLGELGTFSVDGDSFQLISDAGLRRRLARTEDQLFTVEEQCQERGELSLDGWILTS